MKKTSLLLLILFIIPLANALTETHLFFVGDSFEVSGKNVTLVAIGSEQENIVVCINNQKFIVTDEQEVSNVEFNFENIEDNFVELKLKFPSSGECDESCSNDLCFPSNQQIQNETTTDDEIDIECVSDLDCSDNNQNTLDKCIENHCVYEPINEGYIVGEEKETSFIPYFSISLLILVIILLLILFFKKYKKKR